MFGIEIFEFSLRPYLALECAKRRPARATERAAERPRAAGPARETRGTGETSDDGRRRETGTDTPREKKYRGVHLKVQTRIYS